MTAQLTLRKVLCGLDCKGQSSSDDAGRRLLYLVPASVRIRANSPSSEKCTNVCLQLNEVSLYTFTHLK